MEEKLNRIRESYENVGQISAMAQNKDPNVPAEECWEIGQGFGKSKKAAKLKAAKQGVKNLFSEIEFDEDGNAISYL